MSDLQRALEIAVVAHRGQLGKDGVPYVLHPIRLMLSLDGADARIAALLHDVVEDTDVELSDLRAEGFSEAVLDAVELLTKVEGEDYDEYVQRLRSHPVAKAVKMADLRDNMNITRLADVADRDLARLRKYHRVWKLLSSPDTASAP